MRRFLFFLALVIRFALPTSAQKHLCVTIDDLPTVSLVYQTASGRDSLTRRLLTHLTRHRVPAIGFVVGGKLRSASRVDANQLKLLQNWLNAGMELGNHTFAHKGFNAISAAEYQRDVVAGESAIQPLLHRQGQALRYFRHPYLQRGNTVGKRDSLARFLTKQGYREAPVSIDNADYLFSAAYDRAVLRHDSALAATVGNQYVDYMLACVHYYEAQADSLFKRPIPHVLLTHANTINSVFLGTLLGRLEAEGYAFVSLDQALRDPAYRSPDAYVGTGGISWLHRWALTQGKKGNFFKGEPDVPIAIQALAGGN